MPIFSPRRLNRFVRRMYLLLSMHLLLAAGLIAASAGAQTLAHPNWVGNGMSTDPWWQHAILYRVMPSASPVDYRFFSARINALRAIGVDGLVLPAAAVPDQAHGTGSGTAEAARIDELDELIRQGSGRGVRILLTLAPASPTADLTGVARFWLSRGIAGFLLTTPEGATPEQTQAMLQSLRRLTAGNVGQRIVLTDRAVAGAELSGATGVRRTGFSRAGRGPETGPQLGIDDELGRATGFTAAEMRPVLERSVGEAGLLLDVHAPTAQGAGNGAALAQIVAALALVTHPASLIDSSSGLVLDPTTTLPEVPEPEEQARPAPVAAAPPPGTYLPFKPYVPPSKAHAAPVVRQIAADPLTTWYRELAGLHHGNAAFRSGNIALLDFDAQDALVWVARPANAGGLSPAVVVACNLSGTAVQLGLKQDLQGMGLRGNYLRTLLRSDHALGPQDLNMVTLPAYSVYIGELRR